MPARTRPRHDRRRARGTRRGHRSRHRGAQPGAATSQPSIARSRPGSPKASRRDCSTNHERMERLSITFVDRYLAALDGYRAGRTVTKSWELALDTAEARRPIVLQHLLLAINAHVNLDLGIAAAETAPGRRAAELAFAWSFGRSHQRDHRLADRGCAPRPRHDLAVDRPARPDRWPPRRRGHPLQHGRSPGPRRGASPSSWRRWRTMTGRARSPPHDVQVGHVASGVLRPGLLTAGLLLIRARESNDIRRNIEVLNAFQVPTCLVKARVHQDRATPL